jgi:hypothetical protein
MACRRLIFSVGRLEFVHKPREAEIKGGLEHPGIVPIYDLEISEDGRPDYTMGFPLRDAQRGRQAAPFRVPTDG